MTDKKDCWEFGRRIHSEEPNLYEGFWLVNPAKLDDDTWGVWLEDETAKKGDGILIRTQSGKEWDGFLVERESPGSYKWKYKPVKRQANTHADAGWESPEDLEHYHSHQEEYAHLAQPQS